MTAAAAALVHVYGVVRAGDIADPMGAPDGPGMAGRGRLRILPCGDVAALVSDLTLPDGGSLDEILQDNRRARQMILDHHRVLERLIERHSVLPLRFGAMFADDAGVMAALRGNCGALARALDRVDGALEWGLKIFCDRDTLGRRLAGEVPAIGVLESEIADTGEGKAFFLRRRLERLAQEEVEAAIERCLKQIEERSTPIVRDAAAARAQPREIHGHAHEMVRNRAYLVARGAADGFLSLIDDLRASHESFGFDLVATGPWPPYSFADCRLGGRDHAA